MERQIAKSSERQNLWDCARGCLPSLAFASSPLRRARHVLRLRDFILRPRAPNDRHGQSQRAGRHCQRASAAVPDRRALAVLVQAGARRRRAGRENAGALFSSPAHPSNVSITFCQRRAEKVDLVQMRGTSGHGDHDLCQHRQQDRRGGDPFKRQVRNI
jgi:hypothetical protein